jgi:hypothetical protein
MLRSIDHLMHNRAEALRHRRAALLHTLRELEPRLEAEARRCDRRLAAITRRERALFSDGYLLGLLVSLLLGLCAVAWR